MRATKALRAASWLVVAGMLVTALLAPASTSAATSGAIWTTFRMARSSMRSSYTSKDAGVPQRGPAELR